MKRIARFCLYGGVAGTVIGLGLIHSRYIGVYDLTSSSRFGWAIAYMLLLSLAAYGVGLPDLPRTSRQALTSSLVAAASGAAAMSVAQLVVGAALLPRFVVFGSAILLVPWYLVCVAMATDGGLQAAIRERVLVISDSISGAALRHEIAQSVERPARLVRVVPLELVEPPPDAPDQPLVEQVGADRASVLVLDRDAQASAPIVAQAATLHQQGLRVRTLSLFYEEWLGMLPVSELEQVSLLFDIGELHRSRYGRVKRVIDVAFALLALPVLVVVVPFVVIGNLIGNRGSLFYSQPRVGKNGAVFNIYKFRTMRAAPDDAITEWTGEDDPRITRFGRVLRVSHLDELPQVLNILKGDLAVVGPRPEQPHYVEELSAKLPFYELRHLVRPGLTGWAQVKYGYAGDESDAVEKLQYEFYYLRHQSVGLDLRIIGRTIRSVLRREGR